MPKQADSAGAVDKLAVELRRGTLALAALSALRTPRHGYSLVQELAERGMQVEPGTLYPLLRRLDEQGLLDSRWDVGGSRPRKYYELSASGAEVLESLCAVWGELVETMSVLLAEPGGRDATD